MKQEHEDDDAHHDHLFDQRVPKRRHRIFDQSGTIVGGDDVDPFWKASFDFLEPLLHALDDRERVFAVAHDDHAARGLALTIQLGDAAPDVWPDTDHGYISHAHG